MGVGKLKKKTTKKKNKNTTKQGGRERVSVIGQRVVGRRLQFLNERQASLDNYCICVL